MNNVIVLQISLEKLRKILQGELDVFVSKLPPATSSSPAPSKELLTLDEASSYLNLVHSTIYNLVYRKAISYIKRTRKALLF
jgi:excisionase family DNA binding protein